MNKIKKWLKIKIIKWLDIDKTKLILNNLEYRFQENEKAIFYIQEILKNKSRQMDEAIEKIAIMGVDVHFNSPHQIFIISKINGGQIRHIDIDVRDLKDLMEKTKLLSDIFGIREPRFDGPPGMNRSLNYEFKKL